MWTNYDHPEQVYSFHALGNDVPHLSTRLWTGHFYFKDIKMKNTHQKIRHQSYCKRFFVYTRQRISTVVFKDTSPKTLDFFYYANCHSHMTKRKYRKSSIRFAKL